jgi:hypothetical protein
LFLFGANRYSGKRAGSTTAGVGIGWFCLAAELVDRGVFGVDAVPDGEKTGLFDESPGSGSIIFLKKEIF